MASISIIIVSQRHMLTASFAGLRARRAGKTWMNSKGQFKHPSAHGGQLCACDFFRIYICVCMCKNMWRYNRLYHTIHLCFFFQLLGGLERPPIYIYIIYIYIYNIFVAVWDTYLCSQLCFRFSLQDSLRGDAYALKSLHGFEQLEPSEEEGCWFEYIYIYTYKFGFTYDNMHIHVCMYIYMQTG